MEYFVERMLKEYKELEERFQKLGNFLCSDKIHKVSEDEQSEMERQFHAMFLYLVSLRNRLKMHDVKIETKIVNFGQILNQKKNNI